MASVHAEMHGEHRQWLSDNVMWRDDLALWQKETDRALDGLKKLEESLRAHGKELRGRLDTIAAEEKILKEHEHALAEFERGEAGEELPAMAKSHKESADKHTQQRMAHELLKKQHHVAMACWSLLVKALTQKA